MLNLCIVIMLAGSGFMSGYFFRRLEELVNEKICPKNDEPKNEDQLD